MELFPDRVFSKPEFTALPPYLFSGADFALIPSHDEPFGLVAVEFGCEGALGVGSRLGGLGLAWLGKWDVIQRIFTHFADGLVGGSLSSLPQWNTRCLNSGRRPRRPSSPPRRSVSCSALVRPFNVSPLSSGASRLRISTRGGSMLVVGSQEQTLGGRRMETWTEWCRFSTPEIGT